MLELDYHTLLAYETPWTVSYYFSLHGFSHKVVLPINETSERKFGGNLKTDFLKYIILFTKIKLICIHLEIKNVFN